VPRKGMELFYFVELGDEGGAGAGDGAVVVDGEDAGIGDHHAEVAAGDDFFAFDGVRACDGVAAEGDVGFAVLEFGVDRARGIPVLALGAAAASEREEGGGQDGDENCFADS